MTHYPVSSPVTMQSESMSINEMELESTMEELEVLVQKLGVVKSSILELFHSLRSSNQQLGVVHKTESEVEVQPFISQSGTKKSKTFLSSKTTKEPKTTEFVKLDYSIQLSQIFYQRFLENGEITLFSPHDVLKLYEAFGTEEFDELYEKYERATSVPKTKVSARELITDLLKERAETTSYLHNEY